MPRQAMKNIQIVDGAANCTYSIFQATVKEFRIIFPEPGQDIEFAEDLADRIGLESRVLDPIWNRPVAKQKIRGIHGTLFYDFERKRHHFPASKREQDWNPLSLNPAQRKMYEQLKTGIDLVPIKRRRG